MKRILINIIVYMPIIAGIVADSWFGYAWTGNLSLFAIWILIIMTFVSLSVDSKDMFKPVDKPALAGVFCVACVVTQVAAGWIVTAIFFSIACCLFAAKRLEYMNSLKGEE